MKNILLWVAVLPGALLAAVGSALIIGFIIEFWQADFGIHWLEMLYFYTIWAFKSLFGPIVFVLVGMRIAPTYKRKTGIFLIGIAVIYSVTILVFAIYSSHISNYELRKKDYVFYVFDFIGCYISTLFIPKNDIEFNQIISEKNKSNKF